MIFVNLIPQHKCFACGLTKPLGEFYCRKQRNYAPQAECKPCNRDRRARWWKSNAGKLSSANTKLKARFGISLVEYNARYAAQNGQCLICGAAESTLGHRLAIDHCHITNKLRGLLCKNCNIGIGNLQDSPELCIKAAEYLKSYV